MNKADAEKLAIKLTTEILKTSTCESLFTPQAKKNAENLADFISALSHRFQHDLDDDNVDLPL